MKQDEKCYGVVPNLNLDVISTIKQILMKCLSIDTFL